MISWLSAADRADRSGPEQARRRDARLLHLHAHDAGRRLRRVGLRKFLGRLLDFVERARAPSSAALDERRDAARAAPATR